MKWIKASERLPEVNKPVALKFWGNVYDQGKNIGSRIVSEHSGSLERNEVEWLDETPSTPANDMTAREFFCGEGGAITLDFLNEGEREFLLNAIELYASGKVKKASSTPANVGIDFQKLETLAWQVEKGQISADVLVEWVKKMSTRDSANVGGGLEIFKQIAANAWNSAYGGDSFLSGEDYAESLNFSDVTLPASPSLPDNIEHWVEKLYPISDEFTDNSEDIVKRERSAFIRGLKSQVQSQAASPSLGEIEKKVMSIKRNAENINEVTWSMYKEQIIDHVEDIIHLLSTTPPTFPTREEAEQSADKILDKHFGSNFFTDHQRYKAVLAMVEHYDWMLSKGTAGQETKNV